MMCICLSSLLMGTRLATYFTARTRPLSLRTDLTGTRKGALNLTASNSSSAFVATSIISDVRPAGPASQLYGPVPNLRNRHTITPFRMQPFYLVDIISLRQILYQDARYILLGNDRSIVVMRHR